jgi:hypothetical protein
MTTTSAPTLILCRHCGVPFKRNSNGQVFCSSPCCKAATNESKRSPQVVKNCVVCDKEFETNTPIKICCSRKCQRERMNQAKAVNPLLRLGAEGKCKCCGKAFERNGPLQLFCSAICRKTVINERNRSPQVVKRCVVCEKEFESNTSVKICCSVKCANERRRGPSQINEEVKCKSCGTVFKRKHHLQVFCSDKCRRPALVYPPRNCVSCGNPFTPRRIDAQTCSLDCRQEREVKHAIKKRALEQAALRAVFGDDF